MKILVTGVCGFAGSTLALGLRQAAADIEVLGIDNFMRPGSELNRDALARTGINVRHGDVRVREDLDCLPRVDFVIDAAANPSVLAGTGQSETSSRHLMQHNLLGTLNTLELCRSHGAGLILLSTSRVYSIPSLMRISLEIEARAFRPAAQQIWPAGISAAGVAESCSTAAPVSLYGATKVCSEALALEYGATFGFPVWIDRLGVLAGAGQFGRADQGIFSFWIHSCAQQRLLRYMGFGGEGYQVRDCLHPNDLLAVLLHQLRHSPPPGEETTNFSGGVANSMSLRQLHAWCEERFGGLAVGSDPATRPFDVPWLVLDSSNAARRFNWRPSTSLEKILEEIAVHAEANPSWLDRTTA